MYKKYIILFKKLILSQKFLLEIKQQLLQNVCLRVCLRCSGVSLNLIYFSVLLSFREIRMCSVQNYKYPL